MKRFVDICLSVAALLLFFPLLAIVGFLIWRQDRHSPFYIARRAGINGKAFEMVKLRSMVVNADRTGVSSTSADDRRITPVGKFIRAYKLDELMQLWNVLKGDMSLVGPRPNLVSAIDDYTLEERRLLDARPGITDFSSIVFADEGGILEGSADPDLDYERLIRPWKSRLGVLYVRTHTVSIDLTLIALTVVNLFSRKRALRAVSRLIQRLGAADDLVEVAKRDAPLTPQPLVGLRAGREVEIVCR